MAMGEEQKQSPLPEPKTSKQLDEELKKDLSIDHLSKKNVIESTEFSEFIK